MGYMGLENWNESDNAADLMYVVKRNIVSAFRDALDDESAEGNKHNTNAYVNIALLNEAFILPSKFHCFYDKKLTSIFDTCIEKLTIEWEAFKVSDTSDWHSASARREHIDAYARMINNLEKSLKAMH